MRTLIIFNPTAGQSDALEHELDAASEVWASQGWQVARQPTQGPGDGCRLARAAAEAGYDLVVAAGGDGTINEVVNGLALSRTALATLPLGTMNVWARELGLPLNIQMAAQALLSWHVHSIDLGQAGERYFLLMAGIGFDAAITAGIRPAEKRRFGALAYVLRGLEVALKIRGSRVRIILDGRSIKSRVLMIVVGNTQLYGGLVKITHRASIDDGLLDVCVIRGDSFISALRHIVAILRRRYSLDPELDYYRVRTIQIIARPRLPIQVDGDPIGETPMSFTVAPGALRALLPQNIPDDLMQQPSPENPHAPRSLQGLVGRLFRR